MKIRELFQEDEEITIESYLNLFGITDIEEYLKPSGKYIESPMLYDNMVEGIQAFKYHYLQKDKAYILCDSGDTDGITSTTIIYQFMKRLNPKWNIKILIHTEKQRGLQDKELFEKVISEPRPLLIIPDSGTNDRTQVNKLTEIGTTVIVLDHHSLSSPIESGILINNELGNVDKYGSGCVVTHKFIQAICNELDIKYAKEYIDMVALSIISDGMNVWSMQNRAYLYYGMFKSRNMIHNKFLSMLFDNFIGNKEFNQRDISFKIVPKINAICRSNDQRLKQQMIMAFIGMEENKIGISYELLIEELAKLHKAQIDYVNKYIENNIDIIDKTNDIIIHSDKDVIRSNSGLLAGRIKDRCKNKPTIIGKDFDGVMIGSLRSDIPLREMLESCEYVDWAMGHPSQCGVQIKVDNIPYVIDYINGQNIEYTSDIDVLKSYAIKSIPKRLYGLYDGLESIWSMNTLPKPIFHMYGIRIRNTDIKILGARESVIKFTCNETDFVKFDNTRKLKEDLKLRIYNDNSFERITTTEWIDVEVVGFLTINEWNGNKKKQVIIDKIEVKPKKELTFDELFG